jgi:hypothetical protein
MTTNLIKHGIHCVSFEAEGTEEEYLVPAATVLDFLFFFVESFNIEIGS